MKSDNEKITIINPHDDFGYEKNNNNDNKIILDNEKQYNIHKNIDNRKQDLDKNELLRRKQKLIEFVDLIFDILFI